MHGIFACLPPICIPMRKSTSIPTHYDPRIKEMIRAEKGAKPYCCILIAQKHSPSSPEGDERAVRIVRDIADRARQAGVRVALYPHVGYWVQRVEDAMRIVKADRENLGLCFNLYHWLKTDHAHNPKPSSAWRCRTCSW